MARPIGKEYRLRATLNDVSQPAQRSILQFPSSSATTSFYADSLIILTIKPPFHIRPYRNHGRVTASRQTEKTVDTRH